MFNRDSDANLSSMKGIFRCCIAQLPIRFYCAKNKIAIHKRFDNANMYRERPGVILNNLLFIDSKNKVPTSGE